MWRAKPFVAVVMGMRNYYDRWLCCFCFVEAFDGCVGERQSSRWFPRGGNFVAKRRLIVGSHRVESMK